MEGLLNEFHRSESDGDIENNSSRPRLSLPFANGTMTLLSLGTLNAKLLKSIPAVAVLDKSMNGPVFSEPVFVAAAERSNEEVEIVFIDVVALVTLETEVDDEIVPV
uniref:Uncharacterized protein n=1 Tax=Glossina morsitans morsitans TaxID=37546 RepID=A0A1B0FQP6_GLOMM